MYFAETTHPLEEIGNNFVGVRGSDGPTELCIGDAVGAQIGTQATAGSVAKPQE